MMGFAKYKPHVYMLLFFIYFTAAYRMTLEDGFLSVLNPFNLPTLLFNMFAYNPVMSIICITAGIFVLFGMIDDSGEYE